MKRKKYNYLPFLWGGLFGTLFSFLSPNKNLEGLVLSILSVVGMWLIVETMERGLLVVKPRKIKNDKKHNKKNT